MMFSNDRSAALAFKAQETGNMTKDSGRLTEKMGLPPSAILGFLARCGSVSRLFIPSLFSVGSHRKPQ
jgi:hypothetical protein